MRVMLAQQPGNKRETGVDALEKIMQEELAAFRGPGQAFAKLSGFLGKLFRTLIRVMRDGTSFFGVALVGKGAKKSEQSLTGQLYSQQKGKADRIISAIAPIGRQAADIFEAITNQITNCESSTNEKRAHFLQ